MKAILHKAETRGDANHGWLHSRHTFSFANYHDPERMQFGALRVLNDDKVAGGMGFGTHPHKNMEIVSIPLQGDLVHEDSMGNKTVIRNGDVQIMSAGTGVRHSERNKNQDEKVEFLQIWVLPRDLDITPRYEQITLNPADRKNKLQQIISPEKTDAGVWINQDAWFHLGNLDTDVNLEYKVKNNQNGVYIFVLEGTLEVEGQTLDKRDGFGIWDVDVLKINAIKDSEVLIMEIPM
ncbi:pirin family protein [Flavimarina sp. Hel_I_48]|uniref:pirin family protein n=1 Tax=Flavimarina sp. Hel_I_48 TaxID=1392488 RepID=UPI0004DF19A0|nr:pirin family protein [Flavimarina sp. Hel_I_48]